MKLKRAPAAAPPAPILEPDYPARLRERTPEQDEGGDEGDGQRHAPAPGVVLRAVVDQLGDQDADGDHELRGKQEALS